MALREFWPFEALPNIVGTTLATSPIAFLRPDAGLALTAGATTTASIAQADGTLFFSVSGINSSVNQAAITVPYANVSDFTTRRSFIGMRYRNTMNTSQVTAGSVWSAWLNNGTGAQQALISLPLAASLPEQYFEIMIDRVNKQIVTWIDNVQQPPVSFDFNAFVNGGACTLSLGLRFQIGTVNPGYTANLRHVYFVDDTQDATQCSRLGPVGTVAAPLVSATAPNYVSSDSGTPLSDLSTVLGTTAATQTQPTLTSPSSLDPITLGVSNVNIDPNLPILGVKMDVSAQRIGGTGLVVHGGAKYNNQSIDGNALMYSTPNTMVYNQRAILSEVAPDGTPWTPASLAGTAFSLTPATS